jgi:ribosomal protein L40E
MANINCSFCDHANPVGAKFCNECGAGLGLRPCTQCEAINDVTATYCHHCGTLLGAPAATAVAGAAQAEGTSIARSPAPTRPSEPPAKATDPPATDASGRPAAVSPRELASAAERLNAFWRDSMQAVEVARAMKGEEMPASARQVDVLPLRVVNDTPVIDANAAPKASQRPGPRIAFAAAFLLLAAGGVYYGYERTMVPNAAPASAPVAITPPMAAPAESVTAPPAAASAQSSSPPSGSTAPPPSTSAQANVAPPAPQAAQPSARTDVVAPTPAGAPITDAAARPSANAPLSAAATSDAGNLASTAASQPPASEAPSTAASDPPAPAAAGDRPPEPAATAPARRPPAPETRTNSRPARSPSSSGAATQPVRRLALPAPTTPAPTVVMPPPAAPTPATPAIATDCTDSVAALGLCRR